MRWIVFLLYINLSFAEECAFCKPEVINKQEVYHTCYWRVLVNYQPVVDGHLLIIPIAHRLTRHDLSKDEYDDLFKVEKVVHQALQSRYGTNIEDLQYEKNGSTLQSVNHFHIHVLPIQPEQGNVKTQLQLLWGLFVPRPIISEDDLKTEVDTFRKLFPLSENLSQDCVKPHHQ